MSVYVAKNSAAPAHHRTPSPLPLLPLRATPDGLINRGQAHLFTHHAHHHPSLTICTPQPTGRKKVRQQHLASTGLQQHNLMEHPDPSFLSTSSPPLPPARVLSATPPADCYYLPFIAPLKPLSCLLSFSFIPSSFAPPQHWPAVQTCTY